LSLLKILPPTHHHSHFLATTFDFTNCLFSTGPDLFTVGFFFVLVDTIYKLPEDNVEGEDGLYEEMKDTWHICALDNPLNNKKRE